MILPGITACFECNIDWFPPKTTFQICTISSTPRRAEHCIEYARLFKWNEDQPFKNDRGEAEKPDMDNPLHLRWMYEVSRKRAEVPLPFPEEDPVKQTESKFNVFIIARNTASRA